MMSLEKYIFTLDSLNKHILSKEGIVIYGAGDYGRKLIDYIILQKEEKCIKGIVVTEQNEKCSDYRGIKICEAQPFLAEKNRYHVIIAVSTAYQKDIIEIVTKYRRQYCCITYDVYQDICKELEPDPKVVPYRNIDFLCVGFAKCGTTSLYSALKTLHKIYLSDRKETLFFRWYRGVKDPNKILAERYFNNIKQDQIVGMIEPTFFKYANEVYNFFGSNVKIIFLLKNPVDAIFSYFKMLCRDGDRGMDKAYLRKGKFELEMFDEFFEKRGKENDASRMEYYYWIQQYAKYYSKKQMKIVFFEELLNSPQTVINDILDFLGISDRYEEEKLPLENEGNFVMANIEGHRIAQLSDDLGHANLPFSLEQERRRIYEGKKVEYSELLSKYEQAAKIYGIKMTEEQRKKAEVYYAHSIRKLEIIVDKDLSTIWF